VIEIIPLIKLIEILSLGVFLVCLYIIRDIIKMLKPGSLARGVTYFATGIPGRSMKVIMFAISLWIIKDGVVITESLYGIKMREVYEFIGVIIGLVLSYGLYLLTVGLKEEEKKKLKRES